MSVRGDVIRGTVRRGNICSGNCPSGKCLFRENIRWNICWEISLWGIAHSGKYSSGSCPSGKCFRGIVRRGNVCRREVHRRNVPSVNCPGTLKVWSQKPLLLKISYILIYFKKLFLRACFYRHMEQYVPIKQVKE